MSGPVDPVTRGFARAFMRDWLRDSRDRVALLSAVFGMDTDLDVEVRVASMLRGLEQNRLSDVQVRMLLATALLMVHEAQKAVDHDCGC